MALAYYFKATGSNQKGNGNIFEELSKICALSVMHKHIVIVHNHIENDDLDLIFQD